MRKDTLTSVLVSALLLASFSPVFVPAARAQGSTPEMVNIPGTHQDELGCPGEWQPDCEITRLTHDAEDDVWQGTFEIRPDNDADKKGPRAQSWSYHGQGAI